MLTTNILGILISSNVPYPRSSYLLLDVIWKNKVVGVVNGIFLVTILVHDFLVEIRFIDFIVWSSSVNTETP